MEISPHSTWFYQVGGVGAPPDFIRFYLMTGIGVDKIEGNGKAVRFSSDDKGIV